MTATNKFKVRLISPWSRNIETQSAIFAVDIPTSSADALLCEWAPSEELFGFVGPKAWYCCEPKCQFDLMGNGLWTKYRSRLRPAEFLSHNSVIIDYRVPHITHFHELEMNANKGRLERAVSVVSNFGGGPRRRHPEIAFRNRFATNELVDLYGKTSWKQYREKLTSFRRLPGNYKGEVPGDWPAEEKRKLLSSYKVCVCLENMLEPNYFTEKLVEAVAAGCIPVYRAHDSLKQTVLRGARWIDPKDYDDDPKKTIKAALSMDIDDFRVANSLWLKSDVIRATHSSNVFSKIGSILLQGTNRP